MNLKVLEFLRTHSLNELRAEHGVKHRFAKDNTKFCLNYAQFDAKSGDAISECCRGLILRSHNTIVSLDDPVGECEVVCWPMHRFYNHDDPHAAKLDWTTSYAQEKLDGTMCSVYFDEFRDEWFIATRAVPEADIVLNDSGMTFSMLFKKALHIMLRSRRPTHEDTFDFFCQHLVPRRTYVFELTTPWNSVVIKHASPAIHLIAVRDKVSGIELSPADEEVINKLSVPTPIEHALSTLDEMVHFVESRPASDAEGVVVVDRHMNRVKIKSVAYNLANKILDLTPRMAVEAFIAGKLDDIISNADKDTADDLVKLKSNVTAFLADTDTTIAQFKSDAMNRKHYAEIVNLSSAWVPACFALFSSNHCSTLNWLQHLYAIKRLTPSLLDAILSHTK